MLCFFFLKNYGSYSQIKNVEEGGLLSLIHHTQPFHCYGLIPTFASQNRQLELRTSLIVEKIPSAHTKIISLDAKALKCSFLSSRDHVYRRDAILIFWLTGLKLSRLGGNILSSSTASYLSEESILQGICDELALKILIEAVIARLKQLDVEDNDLWVKIII